MNGSTRNELLATPVGDLAALPATALYHLATGAQQELAAAKRLAEHIDHALEQKYAQRAQQQRLAAGKDTGVVHFEDGSIRITADLPKKVEWDQRRLGELFQRIAASGDDPAHYIEVAYRVSETKFNAWPAPLREAFLPARTLKTGKPGFKLTPLPE